MPLTVDKEAVRKGEFREMLPEIDSRLMTEQPEDAQQHPPAFFICKYLICPNRILLIY